MMALLRKHRQWLMTVIAILAIPFIFYFVQSPDYGAIGSDQFGRIYDRDITRVEYQRNMRFFDLARDLGMYALLQELIGNASTEREAYLQFTINRLVLSHEAKRLGILPTTAEIFGVVKDLRPFRTEEKFDLIKYEVFVKTTLPSMGFNETHIEELAGDQLRLERIKSLLAVGVHVPEAESKADFEQAYGKMEVRVVRFRNDDFAKNIQITDEDVTKYYEAHKAELNTEEKRKVEFVSLAFTEEQKKLTGKERIEPLQKLADRANDFTQALLEKDAKFPQAAAKFQLSVRTTGDFTAAAPDPQLKDAPQLTTAAFQLTQQEPNSDVIQAEDGFYVLHLAAVDPARPLTLEEAKPKIVETLRKERLTAMVSAKASEVAQQIREKIKSGTTLEAAIQQVGVKAEKLPPFSVRDSPLPEDVVAPKGDKEDKTPDLPAIKQSVAELRAGEISPFTPTPEGGLIAVLEKREPFDTARFEKTRGFLESRALQSKRTIIFHEWLKQRQREAGVLVAKA